MTTPEIQQWVFDLMRTKSSDRDEPLLSRYQTVIDALLSIVISPPMPPGGNNTDIQFNDGGVFGGSDDFTFDKSNSKLKQKGHSVFGNWGFPATATDIVLIRNDLSAVLQNLTYSGLSIQNTYEDTSGANSPVIIDLFLSPTLTAACKSTGDFEGIQCTAQNNSTSDQFNVTGGAFSGSCGGTGRTTNNITGIFGAAFSNSTNAGAMVSMFGGNFQAVNAGSQIVATVASVNVAVGQGGTNLYGIRVAFGGDSDAATNKYGLYIGEMTGGVTRNYNFWSDFTGVAGAGKNFFGAGMQIGATDTNISRTAVAGQIGFGTGAQGSVAGTLRAAGAGLGGAIIAGEVMTVTGKGSVSTDFKAGTCAVAGALTAGEQLTVTGKSSITTSLAIGGAAIGGNALAVTGTAAISGLITTGSATLIASSVNLTNNAAAAVGTLLNAPAAGNPTKWFPINDNGTVRNIPAW